MAMNIKAANTGNWVKQVYLSDDKIKMIKMMENSLFFLVESEIKIPGSERERDRER